MVRLEHDRNAVIVGGADDLRQEHVLVSEPTFVSGALPQTALRVTAKVRYRSPETPCVVAPWSDGRLRVTFDEPQRAVTPGQAIVFYDGDEVLGGGVIATE